jgi:hypothetical protein
MTAHYDQDNGPGTELTEEHRYAIEEASSKLILSWAAASLSMRSN